jgi:lipid II:glycine glycyltransferase (peptidoglycan interpeptide bridge formation enzyme)
MQTANVNRIYELLEKINNKLDNLDVEVHEIKKEMGLEIKPEYIKKLNEIEKESDISFNSMKEFDKHFGFEDV